MIKLQDLQKTIEELKKYDVFTEEELELLKNMETSLDDVKQEIQTKLINIKYKVRPGTKEPVLDAYNEISFYVSQLEDEKIVIKPNETVIFSTGVELELPLNVELYIKQHITTNGILPLQVDADSINSNEIYIGVMNFSNAPITLHKNDLLAKASFLPKVPADVISFTLNEN